MADDDKVTADELRGFRRRLADLDLAAVEADPCLHNELYELADRVRHLLWLADPYRPRDRPPP